MRESEADFQTWVIGYAQLRGWRVAHFRPARTGRGWRTPMQGDPGFPDLVLARNGEIIFAELKAERGRLSAEQSQWAFALGRVWWEWRPRDRDMIEEILR